jgi:hypothetical protein
MKYEIDPVTFLQELRHKRMFSGMCGCGEYQYALMEALEHVEELFKKHYPEAFKETELNEGESK